MNLKTFFTALLLTVGLVTSAQTVSGIVTSDDGPLPGATVVVKGTSNGVSTDFDGNFSINAPADAILEVSFVGFSSQDVPVNGQDNLTITLAADNELDEVVVIGYGSTSIKDATGAVAAVRSEDFNKGVISSPEQLIQGKTAGVQISQSSGEPGAGVQLRIRGTNSVRSNNNPLFVVDGVPLAGDDTVANGQDLGFGTSQSRNPLNFINANDIESISILKDASAAAIYGARGANGVVFITTKSGASGGDGIFEFSSSLSVASAAQNYELLDRTAFLGAVRLFGGDAEAQDGGSSTDWLDVIFRTSVSQNQNLSYSKGYADGNFRATLNYGKQNGIVENSSQKRLTGRLNWAHRFLDDKLNVEFQGTISGITDESAPISGSAGFQGDLLGAAYSANPSWPNDPSFDTGGVLNPANLLDQTSQEAKTFRGLFNLSASYAITDNLNAKLTYGLDTSNSTRKSAVGKEIIAFGNGSRDNGRGAVNDINVLNNLFEATLNYEKEFNANSKLDVVAGFSYQNFNRAGRNISGWGFATNSLTEIPEVLETAANSIESSISGSYQQYGRVNGGTDVFVNRLLPSVSTDRVNATISGVNAVFADTFDFTDEIQSFFGRVNYTLKNRYLFTATVRADGSSRFGSDNQYGIFPSGAFAWKLNEEDFIGEAFSTLKLRLGAGITGNQEGLGYGNFVRRERYSAGSIKNDGDIDIPGIGAVAFAEPSLKWEETTSYNIGLDFGFDNDRFTGSLEFYNKTTDGLLLKIDAAQPSPQPFFFQNLDANVVNEGIEVTLDYDIIQGEDFTWNSNFNYAFNENEIQNFGGQIPAGTIRGQGLSLAFAQILAENQPLFSYFLREFEGFDANGQPIGDNQTFVGKSALPNINAGFSNTFTYKDWSLSAYFSGQFGFWVYNNTRNAFFTAGAINNARNITADVLTSGEAGNAEAAVSTRFLEKGDFIRLQNLSIGYNVPLSENSGFKQLRFSLTGQNLLLITDYSGPDPEVSVNPGGNDLLNGLPTAGIDYTAYPRPRTFTLGLNASF